MTVYVNTKRKMVFIHYPNLNVTTSYNPITLTRSVITMNITCNIVYNMKIYALFTRFHVSVNNYLE
jgi:hypothetical protein